MTPTANAPVFLDFDAEALPAHAGAVVDAYESRITGLVVRHALPAALVTRASEALLGSTEWTSPNQGMRGGEIRTIGDAATPTFTHLRGPPDEVYAQSAAAHAARTAAVFGDGSDAMARVKALLSTLAGGCPAAPPTFDAAHDWAAFNFRALDPGEQIYAHHDNHFGLGVYRHMPAELDRTTLLSFFFTLQAPEGGGELVVYGVRGDDPEVPRLPTRFLDTATIEARYPAARPKLGAGDLLVFDAGRMVHRVTPVTGARPRLTFGGFMTLATDRCRLAFWG
jgi:hypothetical protein